jgi:hypothetical protein
VVVEVVGETEVVWIIEVWLWITEVRWIDAIRLEDSSALEIDVTIFPDF